MKKSSKHRDSTGPAGVNSPSTASLLNVATSTLPYSVVELCGRHVGRCGYCQSKGRKGQKYTSVSFGLSAQRLLCEDYQALIDLGWRRSGTYLYRPVNEETCCPCYTIRLRVDDFKPSRSQRKVAAHLHRLMALGTEREDLEDKNSTSSARHSSISTVSSSGSIHSRGSQQSGGSRGRKHLKYKARERRSLALALRVGLLSTRTQRHQRPRGRTAAQ
ncbi:arginine-trna-protein transferase 1 [Nannochloropsis gaditana]|uniref:Arginine-trna-protein transferase 1 n=1 Tax=Nannochloropsis gaditana TaxID=72520 RepID=W7TI13_9STRA|nr:arginine-trna-protein transferase 1 [Nannochloropsis gaditana]